MEGEKRLDVLNRLGHRRYERSQAARCDDSAVAKLVAEPPDHAVDLSGEAVYGPGPERLDGLLRQARDLQEVDQGRH